MRTFLLIIQILTSAILIGLILIQARGTGLGRTFGGAPVSFARRGLERLVFKLTFIFAAIFILTSVLQLLI